MENTEKTSSELDENVEGSLSYVLGWITGIVFSMIEKKSEFVRFHAMQSTITFLRFTILSIALSLASSAAYPSYLSLESYLP